MNTKKQGDKLETFVFNLFSELLRKEEFFVSGKNSNIYIQKEYESTLTGLPIRVDVSIETFIPGATTYSQLTIIECKNYTTKKVPVDDVREFRTILNEIGEANTKGIMISKLGFQKGSLAIAKKLKLGLATVNQEAPINWINYRLSNQTKILNKVESEKLLFELKNSTYNFIGVSDQGGRIKLPLFLKDIDLIDRWENVAKYLDVPFITNEKIDKIAQEKVGLKFHSPALNFEEFLSNTKETKNIKINSSIELPDKVLASIQMNPTKINISNALDSESSIWRFTLAHELGHYFLHRELIENYIQNHQDESEQSWSNTNQLSFNPRLETQANMFAAAILMPKELVEHKLKQFFKEKSIHKGFLYLDYQPVNKHFIVPFLRELSSDFKVSLTALKIRLINLGYLKDETSNTRISDVLKRMPMDNT